MSSHYPAAGTLLAERYEIVRELGRGGFSIVYLAHDRHLGTEVALKLLVPPPAAAVVARERMRREVQAVRGLAHEAIVAVHDFVEDGAWSFIVMEYVAGPNLAERVRDRGPLSSDDAIQLGRDMANALALAHAHGILHRDVKPQNILIGPDHRGRLADFGSARLDGVTGMTRTGGLVGTLDYLAPELLSGGRGDGRADLYALGLTLHFALTGQLPERPSAHLPVSAHPEGHRPSRVVGAPRLPQWLDLVVARATAEAPERRFPSVRALSQALAGSDARSDALAEPVARCALCGDAEPFGLSVCVRCGGTSAAAARHAILIWPPSRRGDRETVRGAVRELLRGRAGADAADAAAAGERVLLMVPEATAHTAIEQLALRGIPARSVPASAVWRVLPARFYLLGILMAVAGIGVGAIAPEMRWASPLLALCWGLLGVSALRRPALAAVGLSTGLPPALERAVVTALAELPSGTGRNLLADIVRAGRRIAKGAGGGGHPNARADVEAILPGAIAAARRIDELETSLTALERRGDAAAPSTIEALHALERSRDHLVHQLLEVVTSLSRTEATLDGDGDGEFVVLAKALEGSITRHADALREVDDYLDAGGSRPRAA